jgi:molybdopterin converting factor small subunit
MATVHIPTSLRRLTSGRDTVVGQGNTVAEVIDDLERNHPGVRECLLDGGRVRRFLNLYVGDDDIRFLDGLDTKLGAADTLTILPGIAGG